MLHMGGHHGASPNHSRGRGESGSRSGSVQGRKSADIIEEAEEEEEDIGEEMEGTEMGDMLEEDDEVEEVEEVEVFSPVDADAEVEIVDDVEDEEDDVVGALPGEAVGAQGLGAVKGLGDGDGDGASSDTPYVDAKAVNGSPGKGKAKEVVVEPP